MIKELDTVVLTHDILEFGLVEGDLGTVVTRIPTEKNLRLNLSLPKAEPLQF